MEISRINEIENLSIVIERFLLESNSYADAYIKIKRYVKSKYIEKVHVNESVIKNVLSLNNFDWEHEKPPVDWYSVCLAFYLYCKKLPYEILLLLLKASNYFGNYELLSEVYNDISFDNISIIKKCSFLKQFAKAYKNIGSFEDSRIVYRKILMETSYKYKNSYHAYYLMLYAKLCNDYQQRQAWYIAFHKISYNRICNCNMKKSFNNLYKIWDVIGKDSFAKSIYLENSGYSQSLYEELAKLESLNADSEVRIKAHYYELLISEIIGSSDISGQKKDKVIYYYDEYKKIFSILEKSGNIRGLNVRKIQYLKISRNIIEWFNKKEKYINISEFNDLIDGEAISISKEVYNSSIIYNDFKTSIYSKIELSAWYKYYYNNNYKNKYAIDESILHLGEAKKLLSEKYQTYLSEAYYDVLTGLAENYIETKDWVNASNEYKEIYEYTKKLIGVVEDDEKAVDNVININKFDRLNNKNIDPEFWTLTDKELMEIKKRLSVDYKHMLRRMILIADRLYSLSMAQAENLESEKMELSSSFKYHDLSERLKKILVETLNYPNINKKIQEFDDDLTKWKEEEKNIYERSDVNIEKEIINIVNENLTIEKNKIVLDEIDVCLVRFNVFVFRKIINALILNAIASSKKHKVNDLIIKIGAKIVNDICVLSVSDNTGGYECLVECVDLINSDKDIKEKKTKSNGLYLIKNMIKNLTSCEQKIYVKKEIGDEKTIFVPIGKINNNICCEN